MRLSFSVLWFDDNEEYFDSLDLEQLEQTITEWGFQPQIKTVTTPDEFRAHSPFEAYDLIVVDRKLEGYSDGQEFIAEIRENKIYTEMIFYTAGETSDLWKAIYDKQLEGVFVSNRDGIISKIQKIGRQSIRKILDLNNMRGIVMAEVGELDSLLEEIITIGATGLQEEQLNSIYEKFHNNAFEQHQGNERGLAEFKENPQIESMLMLCDSDKRWQNFNRLRKKHDKLKGRGKLGDYTEEVLSPRNCLAHGRPELNVDGGYVFHYKRKKYHFNNATSLGLRQTILRYRNAFSELVEVLSEK